MPTAVQQLVQSLRVKALGHDAATQTDRRLLEAFAQTGDESAFAEVVRRHGPLVLGVCRRILGNLQDAEDAFQATFLVLARKAGTLAWHDSVKNWLHGVACRIAMKSRSQSLKRKQKEKAAGTSQDEGQPLQAWNELRGVLDEELAHLPDKYRLVLLLCYLEGKTRDEAAEQLGWTVGSVKGYLERGREMLKARLSKRGLALSLTLSAGLLSGVSAEAAIPATLTIATVQAAALFTTSSATHVAAPAFTLAQGALNAMMIAKIKTMGFVTALLMLTVGALGGVYYGAADATVSAANPVLADDADLTPAQFLAFVQEREGKKDEGKKTDEILALIKELDLKVGTVSVGFLRDGGGEETYSLGSKDLKVVSTFGQALKLSELAPGLRVWLTLKDRDVTAMRVENPTVPAFISAVDVEKRTVELRAERMLRTMPVAADAKITVNGNAVRFPQIPVEQRVFVTMTFDKKTIVAIQGNKITPVDPNRPKEGRPKDGERPVERPKVERANVLVGTIVEIDAVKNSLGVLTGRPDELKIQAITIGKELKVKVMFEDRAIQELTFAQLTKPMQVTIQLGEDKTTVTGLTVAAPAVRGVVKTIDAAGKKITILNESREEKTFDLDADAFVRANERREMKLADVMPRASVVLALTPDRQRVLGVSVVLSRRDGEQPQR